MLSQLYKALRFYHCTVMKNRRDSSRRRRRDDADAGPAGVPSGTWTLICSRPGKPPRCRVIDHGRAPADGDAQGQRVAPARAEEGDDGG